MKGFTSASVCSSAVKYILVTIVFTLHTTHGSALDFAYQLDTFDKPSRSCELIIVDMCKGEMGYNFTGGPNFLNQDSYTQQDSLLLLRTFQPLILNGCSKQLKPFLCAAYVPMCDPQVKQLIGPCRSVCENVKVSEKSFHFLKNNIIMIIRL